MLNCHFSLLNKTDSYLACVVVVVFGAKAGVPVVSFPVVVHSRLPKHDISFTEKEMVKTTWALCSGSPPPCSSPLETS